MLCFAEWPCVWMLAAIAAGSLLYLGWRCFASSCLRHFRLSLARLVMISLCVVAIYVGGGKTNGVDGASSPRRSPAAPRDEAQEIVYDEHVPVDALRFSAISVDTNRVGLSLLFPTNLVYEGSTIDILFNLDLRSAVWEWATNRVVCADDIGMDGVGRVEFSLSYGVEIPDDQSPLLFKTSVRETVATTMADGAGETGNRYVIYANGHDMVQTNRMSYANFDLDRNSLPDWWEIRHGLTELDESHGETDDNDHDGLINLHEYWAGTNPLVPDGSNTFLSVCARSIDDRIQGVTASTAVPRFLNYFENAPQQSFVLNPDFWLTNVDIGCVSVRHDSSGDIGSKNATAITRRHVIMSNHWKYDLYDFCDTNGNVVTRRVIEEVNISGSDIQLGRLDGDLPDSIKLPKVLDFDTVRLLANIQYLPAVCLNQDKAATVLEMASFDTSIVNSNTGRRYYHLGKCSETNHVSLERCAIRGSTPPGNSSCPVFFLAGDELVLLCTWHMGNPNASRWANFYGPVVSYWLDTIQNKINQWEGDSAGNYQIEVLDRNDYEDLRTRGGEL